MGGRKIKSDHPSTVCLGSQRRGERQRHLVIIVFSTISRLLFLCYFSSLCSHKRLWDVYYHTLSVDIFFLFNFVFFLSQISLRRLAAQVSGLFVEVEGKNFERRLGSVLPVVSSLIAPEEYETVRR